MSNIKLYYIDQAQLPTIMGSKLPKQAKQLYSVLASSGVEMRGCDVVELAVKEAGLETRQAYEVLAGWYFSAKRRPAYVTLGKPTLKIPLIENTNLDEITDNTKIA